MIKAHVLSSKTRRAQSEQMHINCGVDAWLLARQNIAGAGTDIGYYLNIRLEHFLSGTPIVTPYVSKHKTVTATEASADNPDDTHDILKHGNHPRGIHRLSSKEK